MWRAHTSKQGRRLLTAAWRQFTTESGQGSVPPSIPPAPRKSRAVGFLKFLGISIPAGGGGVLGYAWYDPEFRKQLEANVPYAKDVLDTVLPETEKPSVSPSSAGKDPTATAFLEKATMLNIQEEIAAAKAIAKEPEATAPPVESSKGLQMAPEPQPQPIEKMEDPEPEDIQLIDEPEMIKEDEEKADNAALEVAIYKLLTSSQELTEDAIRAQQDVANYTQHHVKLLKHAMDDTTDILNKDEQWEAVAVAYRSKEHAILQADDLVNASKKSIEKLQSVLAESKRNDFTRNNPAIYTATKSIVQLSKDLTAANAQVRQAEAEAKVLLKYKDLVEKGRKQFQKELESLMPEVKIGATSKKLSEDELNSLIAHAHRRIEQLQRQLAEQMALERQRLSKALDAQRQEDHGILIAAVADERLRSQNEFEADKQKLEMEFLVRQEGEIRRQLSRQSAAHSDHIKDVLAVQREQLQIDFNRELNAKILEEREKFQTEVAGWISRLKGIEAAVDARAAGEQLARCAQDLWLACIALNSVIHFGNEGETQTLTPLKNEIETILTVGKKHPFVETVCSSVPELALERGVCTEDQLRKRFLNVASVCRRLGLIDESSSSLYKFIVSFLHSFVVFDNIETNTAQDSVDLSKFDNFGLVAHAQFWMEQGNLEMALRFMNQLTGESRLAANDWMNEARLLLETRQAATTLTAYASATGLANTF